MRQISVLQGLMAVAALGALTGCSPASQNGAAKPPKTYISQTQLEGLRAMAIKACLCERQAGIEERGPCWKPFSREADRYHHSATSTGSGAASSSFLSFAKTGDSVSDATPEDMVKAQEAYKRSDLIVHTQLGYGACSPNELPSMKTDYERAHGHGSER